MILLKIKSNKKVIKKTVNFCKVYGFFYYSTISSIYKQYLK